MICKTCGNKMEDGFEFCSKCGTPFKKIEYQVYNRQTNAGNKLSVAGLTLGIVSSIIFVYELIWFIILVQFNGARDAGIEYAFIVTAVFELLPFIMTIVGLSLSITGITKGRNGMNITGLLLSIFALVIAIVIFILALTLIG